MPKVSTGRRSAPQGSVQQPLSGFKNLRRIIYASKSLIHPDRHEDDVAHLVAQARHRNLRDGISGCLLFSRVHFAQILEGPEPELSAVMDSILADTRHHQVKILERKPVEQRDFSDWGLGYAGPSRYVSGVIRQALDGGTSGNEWELDDLRRMMTGFSS